MKKNDEMIPEKIQIQGFIPHEGEVNRVRHNPHEYTKIASRTPGGEIHIFSTTTSYKKDAKPSPELRLIGHEKSEGYAIEWNLNKNWHLAGGSYNGMLSVWDCNKKEENNVITPLLNLNYHKCEIEDVSYNKYHDCILCSCDDQGYTAFWDTRDCCKSPIHRMQCHEGIQYGIQYSPSC